MSIYEIMPQSRKRASFTLIELVVAIGLMSILLSMMAVVFTNAQGAFKKGRAAVEIHQTASAILETMRQDFEGARMITYWPGSATTAAHLPQRGWFRGIDGTRIGTAGYPSGEMRKPDGTNCEYPGDIVEFTTITDQTGLKSGSQLIEAPRVFLVRYFLVPDDSGTYELRKLTKFLWPDGQSLPGGDARYMPSGLTGANSLERAQPGNEGEPLGFFVVSMNFRYYDRAGNETRGRWTTGDSRHRDGADNDNDGLIDEPNEGAVPDDEGTWPPVFAPVPERLPAVVEVTLVLTDHERTRDPSTNAFKCFTFVDRFYLAAAEGE